MRLLSFLASFILFVSVITDLNAQKAILLEKGGSLKTEKFFVGDRLYYKLKSDPKHWLEEIIHDIDIESSLILFENRSVYVDDIFAIQIRDAGGFVKWTSSLLTNFSLAWNFWTIVALIAGDPITVTTVSIGVGSFAVGQMLRLLFFKTHKIKKRKRLRLIDLTFYRLENQQRT